MDFHGGLRCDMGHRAGPDLDGDIEAVALQHAARCGDDVDARQPGEVLVPVQRLLREQGRLPVQVREDGPVSPARKGHLQDTLFEIFRTAGGDSHRHHACTWGGRRSKSMSRLMSDRRPAIPSPVRQLVKTKGLSPRMSLESASMTSRLAWT